MVHIENTWGDIQVEWIRDEARGQYLRFVHLLYHSAEDEWRPGPAIYLNQQAARKLMKFIKSKLSAPRKKAVKEEKQ